MKKDIEKSMMLVKGERFEKWHSGYYDITQRDKQKEKKIAKRGFLGKDIHPEKGGKDKYRLCYGREKQQKKKSVKREKNVVRSRRVRSGQTRHCLVEAVAVAVAVGPQPGRRGPTDRCR